MEAIYLLSSAFFSILLLAFLKNSKGPPGPFQFPVLGSLPQMFWQDRKFPHIALAKLARKYGDVMSFGLGMHNVVVISSYKLIKEVFTSPDNAERYPLPFIRDRNFGRDDLGIVFSNKLDLKLYFQRKMSLLGFKSKASLDFILQDTTSDILRSIEKERGLAKEGAWAFNHKLFEVSITNCVWSFIAGFKFDTDNPLLLQAIDMVDMIAVALGPDNVYVPFPFLKKMFPVWSKYEEHKRIFQTQNDAMKGIIEEFVRKRKQGCLERETTILGCILEEMEKGTEGFTEEQLVVFLSDMLVASNDTTATMMSWILLYLTLFPKLQEKLYKEIVKSVGTEEHPSLENITRIIYAKAFLYEVFRKVTFFPLSIPCKSKRDIQVNGFTIKKGTGLIFNSYPVHNDPEFWGDPENFRPERFIKTDEFGREKLTKTERVLGFGAGKRNCPGEEFGWNFLQMLTVSLVRKFEFSVLPGDKLSSDPIVRINVSPASYSLKVMNRKDNAMFSKASRR